MKRSYLLSFLLILCLSLAGSTHAQSPVQETPPSIAGGRVILRAGDANSPSYVPPPETFSPTAVSTATISVTYHGFSAEAQNAFQYAVDIWETQISSPVEIRVDAYWTPLGPGVLGSAGPTQSFRDFAGAPQAGTWYPVALANALAGHDLYAGSDIEAEFNSDFSSWYFGTDGNPPMGQYDFVSVVLHELCHGLGFIDSFNKIGAWGSWGLGTEYPYTYDRFVINGSGQSLINTALFPNPSVALGAQLVSNNIFFNGSNAVAAAGGTAPKLYAPNPYDPGSSIAHLDEATYPAGTTNALMTPFLNGAEANHNPGPITLGLFEDLGWTANTTPLLSIDVYTDQDVYSAGETQTFGMDLANSGEAQPVRLVLLLWSSLGVFPVMDVNFNLPTGSYPNPSVFQWTVQGIPAGYYAWIGALIPEGGSAIVDYAVWYFTGAVVGQDTEPTAGPGASGRLVEEAVKGIPPINLGFGESDSAASQNTVSWEEVLKELPDINLSFGK